MDPTEDFEGFSPLLILSFAGGSWALTDQKKKKNQGASDRKSGNSDRKENAEKEGKTSTRH